MRVHELPVTEPEALHHAGTVVLDDHVAVEDEAACNFRALRVLEVEDHRLFVAIDRREVLAEA